MRSELGQVSGAAWTGQGSFELNHKIMLGLMAGSVGMSILNS